MGFTLERNENETKPRPEGEGNVAQQALRELINFNQIKDTSSKLQSPQDADLARMLAPIEFYDSAAPQIKGYNPAIHHGPAHFEVHAPNPYELPTPQFLQQPLDTASRLYDMGKSAVSGAVDYALKHPGELTAGAAGGLLVGAALGMAIPADLLLATGAILGGAHIGDVLQREGDAIRTIMSADRNSREYQEAQDKLRQDLGPELAQTVAATAAGIAGGKMMGHIRDRQEKPPEDKPPAEKPPEAPSDKKPPTMNELHRATESQLLNGGTVLNREATVREIAQNIQGETHNIQALANQYAVLERNQAQVKVEVNARETELIELDRRIKESKNVNEDDIRLQQKLELELHQVDGKTQIIRNAEKPLQEKMEQELNQVVDKIGKLLDREGIPRPKIEWDWNPSKDGGYYTAGTGAIKINVNGLLAEGETPAKLDSASVMQAIVHEITHHTQDVTMMRAIAQDIEHRTGKPAQVAEVMDQFTKIRKDSKPDQAFASQALAHPEQWNHPLTPGDQARIQKLEEANRNYSAAMANLKNGSDPSQYYLNYLETEAYNAGWGVHLQLTGH